MLSSFFRKGGRHIGAIIDIDSGSIGGALVLFEDAQSPRILYGTRVDIRPDVSRENPEGLYIALETLRKRLETAGMGAVAVLPHRELRVTHTNIVFSAPWEQTTVSHHTKTFDTETVITDAHVKEQIEEAKKEIHDSEVAITHTIVHSRVNGYEVHELLGARGKRFETTILTSVIQKNILEEATSRIKNIFHFDEIFYRAAPLILFDGIRSIFPHEKEFLFVSIRGEVTEIGMVHGGTFVALNTMPFGRETFLRMVSGDTSASRTSLKETFSLTKEGLINEERNAILAKRSEGVEDSWKNTFCDVVESMAKNHPLPDTLFLVAERDARSFFGSIIASCDIGRLRLVDRPFRQILLEEKHVAPFLTISDHAEPDIFIELLSLFSHTPTIPQGIASRPFLKLW